MLVRILGFLGMRQDVPPTTIDVEAPTVPALPLYECVGIDPSELPRIVLRQGFQYLNPTASTHFPRIQN